MGLRVGTIEMDDPHSQLSNLAFFNLRDGKRIFVGDRAHVTPTTVQRRAEGSIVGTVRRVSPFPITQESVINNVGNEEIARSLLQQGGAIEVEVDLERDPTSYSGFRWTSKDPQKKFSAGTTATVRITIEQRAPDYLLAANSAYVAYGRGRRPHARDVIIRAATLLFFRGDRVAT